MFPSLRSATCGVGRVDVVSTALSCGSLSTAAVLSSKAPAGGSQRPLHTAARARSSPGFASTPSPGIRGVSRRGPLLTDASAGPSNSPAAPPATSIPRSRGMHVLRAAPAPPSGPAGGIAPDAKSMMWKGRRVDIVAGTALTRWKSRTIDVSLDLQDDL